MNFIIEYWIEVVFGLIIALVGYLVHRLSKYYESVVSSVDSVRVLLKAKIIEEYNRARESEKISIYQKQVILDLYYEYQKLGSDKFVDEIIEDIDHIPVTKC